MTVPTSRAPQPRLIALLPLLLPRSPITDISAHRKGTKPALESERAQTPAQAPITPAPGRPRESATAGPSALPSRELPQWHRRSVRPRTLATLPRITPSTSEVNATGPNRQSRPRQRRTHLAQRVSASSAPSWSREGDIGVQRTSSRGLTPAKDAATVLVQALLEVLSRRRTREQLVAHCAPDIYHGLPYARHCDPASPARLLTIWVCEPVDGIAEVSAAFRCGGRVRALALQLTSLDSRWRITELQIG